jgi:hypothetical protein
MIAVVAAIIEGLADRIADGRDAVGQRPSRRGARAGRRHRGDVSPIIIVTAYKHLPGRLNSSVGSLPTPPTGLSNGNLR